MIWQNRKNVFDSFKSSLEKTIIKIDADALLTIFTQTEHEFRIWHVHVAVRFRNHIKFAKAEQATKERFLY